MREHVQESISNGIGCQEGYLEIEDQKKIFPSWSIRAQGAEMKSCNSRPRMKKGAPVLSEAPLHRVAVMH